MGTDEEGFKMSNLNRLTKAELIRENNGLRQLLADAIHQNTCDARKIKQLKDLITAPSGGVLPRDRAMAYARSYAVDHGVSTRVVHNVVEYFDKDSRTWRTAP